MLLLSLHGIRSRSGLRTICIILFTVIYQSNENDYAKFWHVGSRRHCCPTRPHAHRYLVHTYNRVAWAQMVWWLFWLLTCILTIAIDVLCSQNDRCLIQALAKALFSSFMRILIYLNLNFVGWRQMIFNNVTRQCWLEQGNLWSHLFLFPCYQEKSIKNIFSYINS